MVQSLDDCPVGSEKDVFCVLNRTWYKAKVLRHIQASQPNQQDSVRVHFLGWRSKFDETVPVFSGRIQEANKFSKVNRGRIQLGEGTWNMPRSKQKKRPKMPDAVEVKSNNSVSTSSKRIRKMTTTSKLDQSGSGDDSKANVKDLKNKAPQRRPAKRPRISTKDIHASVLSNCNAEASGKKKPKKPKAAETSNSGQCNDDTTTAENTITCTPIPVSVAVEIAASSTAESIDVLKSSDTEAPVNEKPMIVSAEVSPTAEKCINNDITTTAEDMSTCTSVAMPESTEVDTLPLTVSTDKLQFGGIKTSYPAATSKGCAAESENILSSSGVVVITRTAQSGVTFPMQNGFPCIPYNGVPHYGQSSTPPLFSDGHAMAPMQGYAMEYKPFMPNYGTPMYPFLPYFTPQGACQMLQPVPGGMSMNPSAPPRTEATQQSNIPNPFLLPPNNTSNK